MLTAEKSIVSNTKSNADHTTLGRYNTHALHDNGNIHATSTNNKRAENIAPIIGTNKQFKSIDQTDK